MNWPLKRLDELGTLSRGRSKHRPRNDRSLFGGIYPFVQTGDVKAANFYLEEYSQTYNEKGLGQSKLWPVNTLCITIAANIAETAILKVDACFPDSIIGFMADEDKCDVRFIKYSLDIFKKQFQQISQGATQDNLSMEKLLSMKLPCPDLKTQQKIASILSAYDDLIENNLKRIKLLEEAAQNIYREWFVNFRVNGEQLEPEKETMLPRAWRIGAFGTIAQFLGGYAFKSNAYSQQGRFKVVTIKNVGDRNFDDSRFDLIPEIPKEMKAHCKINEGDILLSLTGNVGRTCLAFGDNLLLNQRVAIVREQQSSFREYVYYLLGSDEMRAQMTNLSNGVAQQNLSPIKLAAHPVVIPENTTVENFSRIAQPMLKQMVTLRIANAKLKEARDLLLPRLMEGSLEV